MKYTVLWMLLAVSAASYAKPETLVEGGYDQKEMDQAIARARSELDSFIEILAAGKGTNFAVKTPIEDHGKVEHFWITQIKYRNGKFEGIVGNEPGVVSNVKLGDKITVDKKKVSDWLFMRDGKMYGNYTLRPLLPTMPKDEADQLRSMLANP